MTWKNNAKFLKYRYSLFFLCFCLPLSCTKEIKPTEGKLPLIKKKSTIITRVEETKKDEIDTASPNDFEIMPLEDEIIEEIPEVLPEFPQEIAESLDADELFSLAEESFNKSQLNRALSLFKEFLSIENAEKVDTALFKIGQIYFYIKNYTASIENFTKIRNDFPSSAHYRETEYYLGLNNYFLGNHETAVEIFDNISPEELDHTHLSEIHYFNGKSKIFSGHLVEGIVSLIEAKKLSDHADLHKYATQFVKDTIMERLDKDSLIIIAKNYEFEFPSEYALYRLVYLYAKEKDYESVKKTLGELLLNHEQFEFTQNAQNWLRGIEAINHSKEIKIGCLLPLSGKRKEAGIRVLRGVRLAFNSLKKDNNEFNIRLIIRDTQGDLNRAEALAKEFAQTDNMSIIIGPIFSKTAFKVFPLADLYQIPFFTPTASADGLVEKSNYLFRNCMTHKSQGKAIAEYAFNTLHLKRFSVLYPNNMYGTRLKTIFHQTIDKLGGEIVAENEYPSKKTYDFSKEIKSIGGLNDDEIRKKIIELYQKEKISQELPNNNLSLTEPLFDPGLDLSVNQEYIKTKLTINYDALYIPGYANTVGLIAPELTFFNISGIQLLGSNGWNSQNLAKVGGKYVNGSFFVDGFFVNSSKKRVKKFAGLYRNAFQKEPDILSAQSFDAIKIIGMALNQGLITREGIREYLSKEVKGYKGVSGITTLLPSGESEKELFYLSIRQGDIVEVGNN